MNKRIIFPNDTGGISLVIPIEECGLTIQEIASKDVPVGKPYKIIDVNELPPEAQHWDLFFNALEHDFSDSDGIGGQP